MEKFKDFIKSRLKRRKSVAIVSIIISGLLFFVIGRMSGISEYSDKYYDKIKELETSNTKISEYDSKVKELESKIKDAEPWFKMGEEEQRKVEEQNARIEEERLAKEKAEKEEQERLAREEELKGYDTGITYDQLARTPDDYLQKKVKFKGKVLQVMEGNVTNQVRLAINGDYDKIILVEYVNALVDTRILEDDYITIRGLSQGLLTYESTMGKSITIPSVLASGVDL